MENTAGLSAGVHPEISPDISIEIHTEIPSGNPPCISSCIFLKQIPEFQGFFKECLPKFRQTISHDLRQKLLWKFLKIVVKESFFCF